MYTGLSATWFALIGLLFAGYFVLEGFDFGVGIVGPLVSRNEIDRRLCLNAIGPTWDGNEVWLITAGGAMFAAFPLWYGKLFNGAYLALFLVLLALIVRNVSFEFRGRVDDRRWRRTWDAANFGGSLVATLVWGVAFTNFAHGLPLTAAGYTGGLLGLLNPLALLGGLAVVALFAFHGSVFLALKTDGDLRQRALQVGRAAGVLAVVLVAAAVAGVAAGGRTWAGVSGALPGAVPLLLALIAVAALITAVVAAGQGRELPTFAATGVAVLLLLGGVWSLMYPMAIPASSGAVVAGVPGVPIALAASQPYTLTVMTIVAGIFTPVVLLYQGWTYWVFRRRLVGPSLGPPAARGGDPVR
jgi:cytochrome d ubiquinol oxidase subunit II